MVGSKFHVSNRKNEYDDNESSSEYNGYSVNPRFGYEFHLNIKRGQVFYGAELTFLFIYTEHTNYYSPSSSIEYNEDINKVMIYGLRPMIGLKYQINRWLSVSTETAVNFSYNTSENHSKTIYTDDTSDQEQNRKSQGFSVWLEPLGLLSINFHF